MPATTSSKSKYRMIYHVTPQNDLYTHSLDRNGDCWCCPDCDDSDPEGVTFTHNSYDRREDYEDGLRKPH